MGQQYAAYQGTVPAEHIERRLIDALSTRGTLSLSELKAALASGPDDPSVPSALGQLMMDGVIERRAHRRAVWFIGYTLKDPAGQRDRYGDLPAPFRQLLCALA